MDQSAPEPSESLLGTSLGHYRIDEILGEGGMGTVYKAYDERLKRRVALKTIRSHLTERPGSQARLAREARAAAALSHPRIATLLDFDHVEGKVFLVFEYLEGHTLRAHLRQRRLSVAEVVEIAIQMAQGLAAANKKGITHRDLKPENVMILEDGSLKLLDFGLAKIQPTVSIDSDGSAWSTDEGHLTAEGAIVGTPHYLTPEQLEGRPVDHRTDLFALGIVLYELITGQLPFVADSPAAEMANVLQARPPAPRTLNPNIPPELERSVLKLLQRDPELRYQSAEDLTADLTRLKQQLGSGDAGQRPAEPEYFLSRSTARLLFIAIQLLYVGMYWAAFRYAEPMQQGWVYLLGDRLGGANLSWLTGAVLFVGLIGFAVRLYLISMVAVDHVQTGVQYRKGFPFFFFLDAAWALMPLSMAQEYGLWLALPCVPPLVYLPFSQRTLIRSAYDPRSGRRTSAGTPLPS